ncbi:MAG: M23 family metallopeptidase [Cyanobacteria bacterium P01_D01_bin.123]
MWRQGLTALVPLALLGVLQLTASAPAIAAGCSGIFVGADCDEGFDFDSLIRVMESAHFSPEEIESVVGIFRDLDRQISDYSETNRLWRRYQDQYMLDYAAMTAIQALGDVAYRLEPLTREDVEVWRETVGRLIPQVEDGLSLETVARLKTLLNLGVWGQFDLPLGDREGYVGNTISGSDQDGFAVSCDRSSCAHVEFASQPMVHGKRWIWGEQEVNGGYGWPLGELNGGKEPTGRHPISSAFKVVLESVDEAAGAAQFGIYFRICIRTWFLDTCSPYFIGPFPWFRHREKDWVLLGMTRAGPDPPPLPVPTPLPSVPGDPSDPPSPEATPPSDLPFCHDLRHPAPGSPVTSEFGRRIHPVTGEVQNLHTGIDLGTPTGTPIQAACDGVVAMAGPNGGYGLYVVIDHGTNERGERLTTGYAHLSRIDVAVGQRVSRGDVVGVAGSTGRSTGPHLHFETFIDAAPQNPRTFIPL